MSEPGSFHTKECRKRFYKILKDQGYQFRQKSSGARGPVEYDIIPPSHLSELEEEALMYIAHDEELVANDKRKKAEARAKAKSSGTRSSAK
eukprot:9523804-Karenia_brevis.AAC.1